VGELFQSSFIGIYLDCYRIGLGKLSTVSIDRQAINYSYHIRRMLSSVSYRSGFLVISGKAPPEVKRVNMQM
jgi:hypothetical protein